MQTALFGREQEKRKLQKALTSNEPEMIAVIGRRRVGKTFLIRSVYEGHIDFEVTGALKAPKEEQLLNFVFELTKASKNLLPVKTPANWMEAFILLIQYLELQQKTKSEKQVVFFDELPWLSTPKSGFLRALGFFWNSWASRQNIVVVICGSAASWMIQKVVNNTGGLYNRITQRIYLEPFNLSDTEAYLQSRHHNFNRYQIVQLYMAIGGIPHYLKEIEVGKSAIQNIEQICFSKDGLLRNEFPRLYPSLFANAEKHIAVIRALATKRQGLTRNQIVDISKLSNGGGLTKVLEELYHSGFISFYHPFGKKKKEKLYRLTDEYSLFYLQFMEDNLQEETGVWQRLSQTQTYKTWSGYAFENLCLKNLAAIKKALGISGVYSQSSAFYKKGTKSEKGTQIDLLIDRNDQVINLCEIKFYNTEFTLTKDYAAALRNKMGVFQASTKTNKQLFWTLITTFGLKHNQHSLGLIQNVLTVDDLFG
ncbi:MAG: ATP-binding protein [Chitinophagales bacterium]